MTTQYFVDGEGNYIGGFDGVEPPDGSIEVPSAPEDARQIWADGAWGPIPVIVPDHVSARQFKMQLSISGLKQQAEAWVAAQDELIQIAYAESDKFLRDDPMMQQGFASLGFTSEQIDAFYTAAAAL